MMKTPVSTIAAALASLALVTAMPAQAQEESDVNTITDTVKARADFRSICQGGADAVRKAVTEATTQLATAGKLKGNPGAAGNAAGPKVGQACRG
jgi:hypothetical protein